MVERSLSMWGTRIVAPHPNTFLRLRQFYFVLADKRKELTIGYKSKADLSWILFTSYLEAWRARDVAQLVELSLRMRGVGDRCPASPKHIWGFENSTLFWVTKGKNWQLVTNRQLIFHEFCSEASSKLEEYGNVAEMAERSLCMREVRGSMPRLSIHFWGFDNSILFWRTKGKNWQLVTNRKLIFHEICSEASSKLIGYGDVAQMVER